VIAFFFGDWLEANVRSTLVIGIGLIFWGVVLWLADSLGKKLQSLPEARSYCREVERQRPN